MFVEKPTLVPAIEAVSAYLEGHSANLTPEHAQILYEINRRLLRLAAQAAELIDINNRMWAKQDFNINFDAATDMIIVSAGGMEQRITLQRADPAVPLHVARATAGTAYHAGESQTSDEEEQALRVELEEKLESYYQSAHRVLKLFGRIPDLAKVKCVAVSRVRNELIEHPVDGSLYSFGAGSSGPRVKPMHRGTSKFNDDGLVPNTVSFVDAIVAVCKPTNI